MKPLRSLDRDTRRARLLAARTRPVGGINRKGIFAGDWDRGSVVGQFRSGRGSWRGLAAYKAPPAPRAVYLVACVSQKGEQRAPARDLYRSDWFRKARAYVEATGCEWFILSAEHGLLHPDAPIAPYDTTLAKLGAEGRAAWGERVAAQIDAAIGPDFAGELIFLAGEHYRSPLAAYAGDRARVPMAGLGIGQQKAWLAAQLAEVEE
ncbi:hypothetical protein GCM10023208_34810 [Erythrobacter westpacificensis]|jgi:hypothetical protein|uniref:DUF6884 domain-containing protein n=1 Tax=Erythrobacter westpacificensis TaxID=1055231 RepID=A0ABP9KU18_9SPHN